MSFHSPNSYHHLSASGGASSSRGSSRVVQQWLQAQLDAAAAAHAPLRIVTRKLIRPQQLDQNFSSMIFLDREKQLVLFKALQTSSPQSPLAATPFGLGGGQTAPKLPASLRDLTTLYGDGGWIVIESAKCLSNGAADSKDLLPVSHQRKKSIVGNSSSNPSPLPQSPGEREAGAQECVELAWRAFFLPENAFGPHPLADAPLLPSSAQVSRLIIRNCTSSGVLSFDIPALLENKSPLALFGYGHLHRKQPAAGSTSQTQYASGTMLQIECLSLHFDAFDQSTSFEPLFCEMYLYNAKKREQISERFYFHMNRDGLVAGINFGGKVVLANQRNVTTLDLSRKLKNASNTRPQCHVTIAEPDLNIYLVLIVERVLSPDTLDSCLRPYVQSKQFDMQKLRQKASQVGASHLGRYRQKILVGFMPLFRVKQQHPGYSITLGSGGTSPSSPSSPIFGTDGSSPANMFPLTSSQSSASLSSRSQSTRKTDTLRNRLSLRLATARAILSGGATPSGSMTARGARSGASSPSTAQLRADGSVTISDVIDKELLVPVLGQVSFNELYRVPSGDASIMSSQPQQASLVEPFDIADLIINSASRRSLKPLEGSSFTVNISVDNLENVVGSNRSSGVSSAASGAGSVGSSPGSSASGGLPSTNATLGVADTFLRRIDNQYQLLSFKFDQPQMQVLQHHYLFVSPRLFDSSRLAKVEKSRNITVKIMLRSEDTFAPDQWISCEPVICQRYQPGTFSQSAFTAVQYHDKQPYFLDQVKMLLPLDQEPERSRTHLLFAFYHVTCGGKSKKTKGNNQEEQHLIPIGFSFLPYTELLARKKKHVLPVYEHLVGGYLSASQQDKMTRVDDVFRVDTTLISNVHVSDALLRLFIERSDAFMDFVEREQSYLFTEENVALARQFEDLIDNMHSTMRDLINSRPQYEDLAPCFSLLITLLLRMLTNVFHYKREYASVFPKNISFLNVVDQLLVGIVRYTLKILKNVVEVSAEESGALFSALSNVGRSTSDTDSKAQLLQFFVDYVYRPILVAQRPAEHAQLQTTYMHEALLSVWSMVLTQYDLAPFMNISYFFFDLIVKDVALYVSSPYVKNEDRQLHLFTIQKPIKHLAKNITAYIAKMSTGLDTYLVQVKVSETNKYLWHFLSALMELPLDIPFLVKLYDRAYFRQLYQAKLNEQRLELLIDALSIISSSPRFLAFDSVVIRENQTKASNEVAPGTPITAHHGPGTAASNMLDLLSAAISKSQGSPSSSYPGSPGNSPLLSPRAHFHQRQTSGSHSSSTSQSSPYVERQYVLSTWLLEVMQQAFVQFPSSRAKASAMLSRHLDRLDCTFQHSKIHQYVALLNFGFFEQVVALENPFSSLNKDGQRHACASVAWILENVPRRVLTEWILAHQDDPRVLRQYVYILAECKRNLEGSQEVDLSLLRLCNVMLSAIATRRDLPAMRSLLEDDDMFRDVTDFLSTCYLQHHPVSYVFKFLPVVLTNLVLCYYNYYRQHDLTEAWTMLAGQILKLVDSTVYQQLLGTFCDVYDHDFVGSNLITTLIDKLFKQNEILPSDDSFSQQFLELYDNWLSPNWLLLLLWLKVREYPHQFLSILELWMRCRPDDFRGDAAFAERVQFYLRQLQLEIFELDAHQKESDAMSIISQEISQFFTLPSQLELEVLLERTNAVLNLLLQIVPASPDSANSEAFQEVSESPRQGSPVLLPAAPLVGATEIVQRYKQFEKMISLFQQCDMHTEVLMLLVFDLHDRDRALQYCIQHMDAQAWQASTDEVQEQSSSTEAPLSTSLPSPDLQSSQSSASQSSINADTGHGHPATRIQPILVLMDMMLNHKKYLPEHQGIDEAEIDQNLRFCRKIVGLIASEKQLQNRVNWSDMLRHVQHVDKLGIDCLKPLLARGEENYEILRRLGRGAQGAVVVARSKKTQQELAIKMVQFDDKDSATAFLREVQSMIRIRNDNIVRFEDFFIKEQSESVGGFTMESLLGCLVIEYLPGGDLLRQMQERERQQQPFNEALVLSFVRQLASAMSLMHGNDLIHRDLKPENILITADGATYKIADFGVVKDVSRRSNTGSNTIVGSVLYMSPELFRGSMYNSSTDIWSFGVILFEMLSLQLGKKDLKYEVQVNRHFVQQWIDQRLGRYGSKVLYILQNCLKYEPESRITAEQMLTILDLHAAEADELYKKSKQYGRDRTATVHSPTDDDSSASSISPVSSLSRGGVSPGSGRSSGFPRSARTPSMGSLSDLPVTPTASVSSSNNSGTIGRSAGNKSLQQQALAGKSRDKAAAAAVAAANAQRQQIARIQAGGGTSATEWFRETAIYGPDHLFLFRLARNEENLGEDNKSDISNASAASLNPGASSSFMIRQNASSFNDLHQLESMPRIRRDNIEQTLVQFLLACEGAREETILPIHDGDDFSQSSSGGSSAMLVTSRSYQEALLMTLSYFVKPERLLRRLILLCQSPSVSNDQREWAIRVLMSWTCSGNLCFNSNLVVSMLLKFCLNWTGCSPSFSSSNVSLQGVVSGSLVSPVRSQNAAQRKEGSFRLVQSPSGSPSASFAPPLQSVLSSQSSSMLSLKRSAASLIHQSTPPSPTVPAPGAGSSGNAANSSPTLGPVTTIQESGPSNVDILLNQLKNELSKQLTRAAKHSVRSSKRFSSMIKLNGKPTFSMANIIPPEPILPKVMTNLKLIDFSEIELARQMTLLDAETFKEIKPYEHMRLGLDIRTRYKQAPNVLRMVQRFNKISRWVSTCVLQKKDVQSRAQRIARLIDLCEQLHSLRNLFSLKAVIFGLHYSAVRRLNKTWVLLQKEHAAKMRLFRQLTELCESNERMDAFVRTECEDKDQPCIPFMGAYLSMIKTIELEQPTFVDEASLMMQGQGGVSAAAASASNLGSLMVAGSSTGGELLNVRKFLRIASVIKEIQRLQSREYNLRKVSHLLDKLRFIERCKESNVPAEDATREVLWSDQAQYSRSLDLESEF